MDVAKKTVSTIRSPRGVIHSVARHIPRKHAKSANGPFVSLAAIPADSEDEIPFYTCWCKYEDVVEGYLHLYNDKTLFHSQEKGVEVLSICLSLLSIDTLKKSHDSLIIGAGKCKYHFHGIEKRKHVIQLVKNAMSAAKRAKRSASLQLNSSPVLTEGSEEMEKCELSPEVKDLMDDPIIDAIHEKLQPVAEYSEPKDLTQTYEKVFTVPLKVVTAKFFSSKSKFFDELHPECEIVQDHGTWKIEENQISKTVLFETPKQAFTVSVSQEQVVHWAPDGSLIHRCDNSFKGFPSATNMTVSTVWVLTPRGNSTLVTVSGIVSFSGFFIGKDKARRQSIEGIAESCKRMEEKLSQELNLDESSSESGSPGNNGQSNDSQNFKLISSSVEHIQQQLTSIVAEFRTVNAKDIFYLSLACVGLQILFILISYFKYLSARFFYVHDEL